MSERLAIWIFGPIAAGKSTLASRLPLEGFRIVDQDSELEKRMRLASLSPDTTTHSPEERTRFQTLRAEVAKSVWREVPSWRAAGENLCFETTGDKPHLFRTELELGRQHGYRSLGVALHCPLDECLARNRGRRRVLNDDVVLASWRVFQKLIIDGIYAELFAPDRLIVAEDATAAHAAVCAWLNSSRLAGD